MILESVILKGTELTHLSREYFINAPDVKLPRTVYIPHHFYGCNGCASSFGEPEEQSACDCVRRLFTHQVVYELGSDSGREKSAYTI